MVSVLLASVRVVELISLGTRPVCLLGSVVASAENGNIFLFSDWESAIRIGVLDCGEEENYETCKEYGIHFYPTVRVSAMMYLWS